MKKLSLFASLSAALACAAVPASFNWSSANVALFSLDTAEARVGRPLTATSVAGVSRRSIGANTAARLGLPLLELLLGRIISVNRPRSTSPNLRSSLNLRSRPDLRLTAHQPLTAHHQLLMAHQPPTASPHQPLMVGRAMATAQSPTGTL